MNLNLSPSHMNSSTDNLAERTQMETHLVEISIEDLGVVNCHSDDDDSRQVQFNQNNNTIHYIEPRSTTPHSEPTHVLIEKTCSSTKSILMAILLILILTICVVALIIIFTV